jgi:hypothetical protein
MAIFKNKYFVAVIVIKLFLFAFLQYGYLKNEPNNLNSFFYNGKDYTSYINPVINLVDNGTYYEQSDGKKLYAHKAPGMLPIFGIVYGLLGSEKLSLALNLLVFIQLLMECLAACLLVAMANNLFGNNRINWLVVILNGMCAYVSFYTHQTTSEALTTCFIIFAFYFFERYYSLKGMKYLFFSGVFIAWAIFFRPISGVIFIPFLILIFTEDKSLFFTHFLKKIKLSVILVFTFLLFDGIWVVRNYNTLNRIIPFDICLENFAKPQFRSILALITSWGGNNQAWIDKSEASWFFATDYNKPSSEIELEQYHFPKHVIALIGVKKLEELRYLHNTSYTKADSLNYLKFEKEIVSKCATYITEYKSKHSIRYYFTSGFRCLKTLLFPKQTFSLSYTANTIAQKLIRVFFYLEYYFVLLLFIASLFIFFKSKDKFVLAMIATILAVVFVYTFLYKQTENRYLITVFPLMTVLASYAINQYYLKFSTLFQNKN